MARRTQAKRVSDPPKGKETLDAMLRRTRGYGLGERNPAISHDGRYDRVMYWQRWGKSVRAVTPVVGMRFDHF